MSGNGLDQVCDILVSMKNHIKIPKGRCFDMDGVLLMTTQSPDQSWQQVCQQFAPGLALAPHLLEEALYNPDRIIHALSDLLESVRLAFPEKKAEQARTACAGLQKA